MAQVSMLWFQRLTGAWNTGLIVISAIVIGLILVVVLVGVAMSGLKFIEDQSVQSVGDLTVSKTDWSQRVMVKQKNLMEHSRLGMR